MSGWASPGEPTTIRKAGPDDVAFIVHAWLEGYWPDCPCSVVMPKADWVRRWHAIIENMLADERNVTMVACSPDSDTFLYGFICARPGDVLHWLYVKQAFRGNGFSLRLQLAAGLGERLRLSSWSDGARRMANNNHLVVYDPRLIREYT